MKLTRFPTFAWILRCLGTGALLFAAVASVAGANWAARQWNQRWDITSLATHTLGAKTRQILDGLSAPVKVTALYPGVAPEALTDLLEEFSRLSNGRVSTEIVDPLHNLGYASQFGSKIDVSQRRVVVQCGKSREELNCTDDPLDESRLAAALYRTSQSSSKVYFLRGHNEYDHRSDAPEGMGMLRSSLEELNLRVDGIELATAGKIPDDCGVLVVAGARTAPGAEEILELKRYLAAGGHALFLVESAIRTPSGTLTELEARMNPTWNEVLQEWGVTMGDDVVVDMSNHMGQDIGCPATSKYPDHDKIVKGLGITFYIRPRSITFEKPAKQNMLYAPLVQTLNDETSWAESDRSLYAKFSADEDKRGPATIASVLMQDPKTWKGDKQTKLVVIGDADFATNQYTGRYSNLDLVVNSISWLAQREVLAAEEKTGAPEKRLEMTSADLKLAIAGLCLAPVASMVLGIAVAMRRRKPAR